MLIVRFMQTHLCFRMVTRSAERPRPVSSEKHGRGALVWGGSLAFLCTQPSNNIQRSLRPLSPSSSHDQGPILQLMAARLDTNIR